MLSSDPSKSKSRIPSATERKQESKNFTVNPSNSEIKAQKSTVQSEKSRTIRFSVSKVPSQSSSNNASRAESVLTKSSKIATETLNGASKLASAHRTDLPRNPSTKSQVSAQQQDNQSSNLTVKQSTKSGLPSTTTTNEALSDNSRVGISSAPTDSSTDQNSTSDKTFTVTSITNTVEQSRRVINEGIDPSTRTESALSYADIAYNPPPLSPISNLSVLRLDQNPTINTLSSGGVNRSLLQPSETFGTNTLTSDAGVEVVPDQMGIVPQVSPVILPVSQRPTKDGNIECGAIQCITELVKSLITPPTVQPPGPLGCSKDVYVGIPYNADRECIDKFLRHQGKTPCMPLKPVMRCKPVCKVCPDTGGRICCCGKGQPVTCGVPVAPLPCMKCFSKKVRKRCKPRMRKAANKCNEQAKLVEGKPTEAKLVKGKPTEVKRIEGKSAEAKSTERIPAEAKPIEVKLVEEKPIEQHEAVDNGNDAKGVDVFTEASEMTPKIHQRNVITGMLSKTMIGDIRFANIRSPNDEGSSVVRASNSRLRTQTTSPNRVMRDISNFIVSERDDKPTRLTATARKPDGNETAAVDSASATPESITVQTMTSPVVNHQVSYSSRPNNTPETPGKFWSIG